MSTPSGHKSKGAPLASYSADAISCVACQLLSSWSAGETSPFPLTGLSLVASTFDSSAANTASLRTMFAVRRQRDKSGPLSHAALLNRGRRAVGQHPDTNLHPLDHSSAQDVNNVAPISNLRPHDVHGTAVSGEDEEPGGIVSIGTVVPDQDVTNTDSHHSCCATSDHKPCATGPRGSQKMTRHAEFESVIPAPELASQQHLQDLSSGTASAHQLQNEQATAMQVDSLTLAQMPSEIRSELYLMSSSLSANSIHIQPKKKSRSSRCLNHIMKDRRTCGIDTFFKGQGGNRS